MVFAADAAKPDHAAAVQPINAMRPNVQQFIDMMVTKHQFNRDALNLLFNKVQVRPEIISSMQQPYEAKPWYIYRKHFISQTRVKGGVKFWQQHKKVLAKVSQQYGVPVSVLVAIIGVETSYGHNRGKYSVLDTLSTLAFDYPPRTKFFTRELEQFLLLAREQHWETAKVLGSYAGAVGQPQFMPSSYRAYAVDYSQDGSIDLFDNIDDIIGSVANYLHKHGWKAGEAIIAPATTVGSDYTKLPKQSGKPSYTLSELLHYGIHVTGKYPDTTKALFVTVEESKDTQAYWLGFYNFYVIKRYNISNLYALAVTQLSQLIDTDYHKQVKADATKPKKHTPPKISKKAVPSTTLTLTPGSSASVSPALS
tara:strand:- start:79677 stop:80774 length:1098 start_codon:yes stop_codon:yes gene_type:complete